MHIYYFSMHAYRSCYASAIIVGLNNSALTIHAYACELACGEYLQAIVRAVSQWSVSANTPSLSLTDPLLISARFLEDLRPPQPSPIVSPIFPHHPPMHKYTHAPR